MPPQPPSEAESAATESLHEPRIATDAHGSAPSDDESVSIRADPRLVRQPPRLLRAHAARLAGALALQRDFTLAATAVFLVSFGEQLWRRFVPEYLTALGAPVLAVGAHGSLQDLLG